MKDLSDNSIDCFIVDLPYGQLAPGRDLTTEPAGIAYSARAHFGCDWDVKIDLEKFWEQVKRLAKNDHTPVLMFCNTKFGIDLINSNPSWFRYDLVWDKGHGVSFLLANKMPMKSHEMVYVFSKKGAFYRRVDVMVRADGTPVVLEVNTLPGMTETSLLPKAAAAAGLNYGALCQRMVDLALARKAAAELKAEQAAAGSTVIQTMIHVV